VAIDSRSNHHSSSHEAALGLRDEDRRSRWQHALAAAEETLKYVEQALRERYSTVELDGSRVNFAYRDEQTAAALLGYVEVSESLGAVLLRMAPMMPVEPAFRAATMEFPGGARSFSRRSRHDRVHVPSREHPAPRVERTSSGAQQRSQPRQGRDKDGGVRPA
jgi:hypothetical protein